MGNVAFTSFLKKLEFPSKEVLHGLFSCNTCMEFDENGLRRWKGLVMDGTATGILSKLPKYHRPTVKIQGIKNISTLQYIIPMATFREFVDAIFISGKHCEGANSFAMELPQKMTFEKRQLCIDSLLRASPLPKEFSSAYDVRSFLMSCFTEHGLKFTHKIQDLDVRRTLLEFGRCFLHGSMPGGILRRSESMTESRRLSDAFRRFVQASVMLVVWHDNNALPSYMMFLEKQEIGYQLHRG